MPGRLHGGGRRLAEPCHRHAIAARFAKRRRQDFDDPKAERHGLDLGERLLLDLAVIHSTGSFFLCFEIGEARLAAWGNSIVAERPGFAAFRTRRPPCSLATALTRLRPRP